METIYPPTIVQGCLCIASFPPRYTIRFPRENDGESYGTPFQQIFKLLGTHSSSTNRAVLGGWFYGCCWKSFRDGDFQHTKPPATATWGVIHPHSVTPSPMIRGVSHRVSPVFFFATRACKLSQTKDCKKRWCISGIFRGQDLFWESGNKNQDESLTKCWAAETLCVWPVHDWTPQCEDWTPKSPPSKARHFFRWIFWPLSMGFLPTFRAKVQRCHLIRISLPEPEKSCLAFFLFTPYSNNDENQ